MRNYLYIFETNGVKYYVYAKSKDRALRRYLEENGLKSLPKGTTMIRTNS